MHESNLAWPRVEATGDEATHQTQLERTTARKPVELQLLRGSRGLRGAAALRNKRPQIVLDSGIYREYRAF